MIRSCEHQLRSGRHLYFNVALRGESKLGRAVDQLSTRCRPAIYGLGTSYPRCIGQLSTSCGPTIHELFVSPSLYLVRARHSRKFLKLLANFRFLVRAYHSVSDVTSRKPTSQWAEGCNIRVAKLRLTWLLVLPIVSQAFKLCPWMFPWLPLFAHNRHTRGYRWTVHKGSARINTQQ
jgi:hypothetical protein